MREKTAKVSIICIIAVFLVSCCGIVMAHRAGVNRRGEFMKNRQFQGHSQMFDRGEGRMGGDAINKQFNRPDRARINPGDPREQMGRMGPGQMGPGFNMRNRENLTREEICKNCPICNKTIGQKGPGFFGEKREGQNRPEFNKPELKIEENKEVEK